MTNPNLIYPSWSVENGMTSEWLDSVSIKLDDDSSTVELAAPEAELEILRSQLQKQADRIRNLETALDQSLTTSAELRIQLVDQQILEHQLAATEEIANIQQHAITQLKQQLADLRQQEAIASQFPSPPLSNADHGNALNQELFIAQGKIQDLETQLSRYGTTHAILHHTCQELEQARDRYQLRAASLEVQTAEMQEQILQQAQQASEYETAIQHWKDRYLSSRDYLERLKDLINQAHLPLPGELAELLTVIQVVLESPEPDVTLVAVHRPLHMDIPDFLARHHRYRVRT